MVARRLLLARNARAAFGSGSGRGVTVPVEVHSRNDDVLFFMVC